jgi:hypothetical protein
MKARRETDPAKPVPLNLDMGTPLLLICAFARTSGKRAGQIPGTGILTGRFSVTLNLHICRVNEPGEGAAGSTGFPDGGDRMPGERERVEIPLHGKSSSSILEADLGGEPAAATAAREDAHRTSHEASIGKNLAASPSLSMNAVSKQRRNRRAMPCLY